ncbi:MAG TPA: N-acetylmuramoyl-L-alanine amidase [Thermoanaerobaculia bacterium]|jgi:N-acetylmuramoyl-L-alanine amidase|nr:N-acetylmuramoyl-L-alanine amidase [Thermoanaerobaculia bacterium]
MRAANIERVKRRMLRQAVDENLDVIRGVPPRALRSANRLWRVWLRRASFVFLPLTLVGSSYIIANGNHQSPVMARMSALPIVQVMKRPQAIAPEAKDTAERMTSSAFPLSVRRIVLDAGHGGTDPGATAKEVLEKEITLDIGLRLRALLEANGFDVVVTRDTDRTIALKDRAALANESKSDIFVSIHVNALEKHTESRGIETYYLGATNDPSLTALAARENRVSGYSVSDMRKLLEDVYVDARRDESHELAMAVQKNLFTSLQSDDAGLENWGVKRAPFIVLASTDMPAVLAEVGCISNEKESAMLRRPEYRQKIAAALFEGIRSYAGASSKGNEKNG